MRILRVFAAFLCLAHVIRVNAAISPAEKQIFEQLNQERQKEGLPALEWSDQLADAARVHAGLLAENGALSHQFPGEAAMPERIGATGARFTVAAENVALTGFIEDVHRALMASPGHRANILSPKYNAIGIGVVEREGKFYATQDFAFVTQAYSEAQFAEAFAEAFNAARKARGIRALEAQADPLLHDAACSTDGRAAKVTDRAGGARAIMVFTLSNPRQLPDGLMGRAADPGFHRIRFNVCFRPDQEHGYANFWVVVAFHGS